MGKRPNPRSGTIFCAIPRSVDAVAAAAVAAASTESYTQDNRTRFVFLKDNYRGDRF